MQMYRICYDALIIICSFNLEYLDNKMSQIAFYFFTTNKIINAELTKNTQDTNTYLYRYHLEIIIILNNQENRHRHRAQ